MTTNNAPRLKKLFNSFAYKVLQVVMVITFAMPPAIAYAFMGALPIYAYDRATYPDCNSVGKYNGLICYVEGTFTPVTPYYYGPAGCTVTHHVTDSGSTYIFCSSRYDLNGQDVTVFVQWFWTGSAYIFNILEYEATAYYNIAPAQPNLIRPQNGWQFGPHTNGTYPSSTCNTAGTGAGCSIDFRYTMDDPDYSDYTRSDFQVRNNTTGANRDFVETRLGTYSRALNLTDGNWQWRGRTEDRYTNSGWTTWRAFTVDTTAPSQPVLQTEPAFTKGTQNTIVSSVSTDNLVGGVQYLFEASTAADFSVLADSSGWVVANTHIFASLTNETKYYYRVRARDAYRNQTNWSNVVESTQDAVAPVLSNVVIDLQRISPQNQDGQKDASSISFDYVEKFKQELKLEVLDASNNSVRVITKDISALAEDETPVSDGFSWDGKDGGGNYVADGAYRLVLTASDKAGNFAESTDNFVVIDNLPADISLSRFADGTWFNSAQIEVAGQTEADANLSVVELLTGWGPTVITLDGVGLFTQLVDLQDGANEFQFNGTDAVGNANTKSFTYYKETVAPTTNSITPNSQINTRRPVVSIQVSDTGFNDGITDYISGIDLASVNIDFALNGGAYQSLVLNGANNAAALGTYAKTCGTNGLGMAGAASCSLDFTFTSDLTPDGDYTVKVNFADKAGNAAAEATSTFKLDSNTYNTVNTPTGGTLFNYSLVDIEGTAELNSRVSVDVAEADGDGITDSETIDLVDFGNNAARVSVGNCRASAAPTTDGIGTICDWKITGFQLERDPSQNVAVANAITVVVEDNHQQADAAIRNTLTRTRNVDVNLFAVTQSVSAEGQYFSPNGDGRQDGVKFVNIASNAVIDTWWVKIEDSGGGAVRDFSGNGIIGSSEIPWDGRDSVGNFVADGTYNYYLEVLTTDGVTTKTSAQEIYAFTDLQDRVVITYPVTGYITDRGVTTVQGQAPTGSTVRICGNMIGISGSCEIEEYATVDAAGSFSVIFPLYRLDGQTNTTIQISATAQDKYGNTTPKSNVVNVTVTTQTPFESVAIIPALSGVNDPAAYAIIQQKLDAGQEITAGDIASLRTSVLRAVVNNGTERVKLSFADHTNLDELPVPTQFNYLGYIDGRNETKLYQGFTDGVNPVFACGSATCTWDFLYPLPPAGGGIYEIEFDGKRGATQQTLTAALTLDANIPAAPIILDVNKLVGGESLNTKLFQGTYYSNQENIEVIGAADPNSAIEVNDQNGNTICATTASPIGLWSCTADIGNFYALNSNVNLQLTTTATQGANSSNSLSPQSVVIDKIAPQFVGGDMGNIWRNSGALVEGSITANEKLDYMFVVDTDPNPVGAQCINATAVTVLPGVTVPVQTGAIYDFTLSADYQSATGSFTISGRAVEGRYCVGLEIQDLAGNRNNTAATFLIDDSLPEEGVIDTSTWGIYNGVYTQLGYVAKGRVVPEYVHEEGQVVISGYAEENQKVILVVDGQEVAVTSAGNRTQTLGGAPVCRDVLDAGGAPLGDRVADGVMTKSGLECLYFFNYTFGKGETGYLFQVIVEDLALNRALISEDELIYYDKTAPRTPETTGVKKSNGAVVNDWIVSRDKKTTAAALGTGNFGKLPISNDRNITVTDYGESRSDMSYRVIGSNGAVISQALKMKGDSGFDDHTYNLKTGDGVYTFSSVSTDAAGNSSKEHMFQLELDTVPPSTPSVSGGMSGLYNISMSVRGEPGAFSLVGKLSQGGSGSGIVRTLDINNDADWEKQMTFCSALTDRAGNRSGADCFTVTTPIRPARPGECKFTPEMQEKFNQVVNGNNQVDDLLAELGYSKSCLTYEADKINADLEGAKTKFGDAQTEAQNCLQEKLKAGASKDEAFDQCKVGQVLGNKTEDAISLMIDQNACVAGKADQGKKSHEAIEACKNEGIQFDDSAEQQFKNQYSEHDTAVQTERDKPWYEKAWDSAVQGVKDLGQGLVDLAKGAADLIKNTAGAIVSLTTQAVAGITALGQTALGQGSLADNFANNKQFANSIGLPTNNPIDDLKQIGTFVAIGAAVVAVVAVGVVAGPALLTLGGTVAGAMGLGAGTFAAGAVASGIAFAGGIALDAGMTVLSAGVTSLMTGTSFTENLQRSFCGDNQPDGEYDLAGCLGYQVGQIASGEFLSMGIGGSLSMFGKMSDNLAKAGDKFLDANKLAKGLDGLDDLTKGLDNLDPKTLGAVDNLGKVSDDISGLGKLSDNITKQTDNIFDGTKNLDNTADDLGDINKKLGDIEPCPIAMAPQSLWDRFVNFVVPPVYAAGPCKLPTAKQYTNAEASQYVDDLSKDTKKLIQESEGFTTNSGNSKGHMLTEHVYASDSALKSKALKSNNAATRFKDLGEAESAVQEVLQKNKSALQNALTSKSLPARISFENVPVSSKIGYGYLPDGSKISGFDKVTLILEAKLDGKIKIVTAFPVAPKI